MSARYRLTLQAQQDLSDIADYIAEDSGLAPAEQVVRELQRNFQFLAEPPDVGHPREDVAGELPVRFWNVYTYLIVFVPAERPLGIVCIVHGARDPETIRRHLDEASRVEDDATDR